MPRIPWTTPAQDKFLQGHGSTFLQKQEAGTLEGWFPSLYELYFAEWPEADPDVEVEVKLRGKLVMQTNLQVRKSRIYHWFYNHCKPTATGRLLSLGNKPRVLQSYQAYQRVRRAILRPRFKQEYLEYCRNLPKEKLDEREEEFTWRNQRARVLFEEETEEVKEQVEAYRQSHRMGITTDTEDSEDEEDEPEVKSKKKKGKPKLDKVSRSLNQLAYTLEVALKNIEAHTGWVASVFVGGWDPRQGKVSTFSVHNGATESAHLQWCAQDGFGAVDESWLSFVHKAFPNPKPGPKKGVKKPTDEAQSAYDADVEVLDDDMDDERPTTKEKGKRRAKTAKEAPAVRPPSPKVQVPTEKAVKKVSNDSAAKRKHQDRESSSESEPEPGTASPSDTDAAMDVDRVDDSEASSSDPDVSKLARLGIKTNKEKVIETLKARLDKVEAETNEKDRPTALYHAFSTFTRRIGEKNDDFPSAREQNIAMNEYYFKRIGIMDDIPMKSKDRGKNKKPRPRPRSKNSPASKKPASRAKSTVPPVPSQSLRRGRSASRHASGATQPPDTDASSESDDSDTSEEPSTEANNVREDATSEPPAKWMVKPLDFFKEGPVATSARMEAFVAAWVDFERSKGFPETTKERLAKPGRPTELTTWISHHRPFERPPKWESRAQLKAYGALFITWWRGLQPAWREGDEQWPMKREATADDSWEVLNCPGANGIFLVVLGAVWWFNA